MCSWKRIGKFFNLFVLKKSLPLHLEAMASVIGFRVLPFFMSNFGNKYESRVQVRSLGDADSKVLSSDSVVTNVTSIGGERGKGGTSIDQGNGHLRSKV